MPSLCKGRGVSYTRGQLRQCVGELSLTEGGLQAWLWASAPVCLYPSPMSLCTSFSVYGFLCNHTFDDKGRNVPVPPHLQGGRGRAHVPLLDFAEGHHHLRCSRMIRKDGNPDRSSSTASRILQEIHVGYSPQVGPHHLRVGAVLSILDTYDHFGSDVGWGVGC